MAARPREIKLVIIGDSGVGKSSLVLRFVTQSFKPFSESTIGASFMSKVIELDGQTVKVQIWDTAGQEKYKSLAPMYYRGAAAAIVVYDITRRESFGTLQRWVSELQEKGPRDLRIMVAGNKKDLEGDRQVAAEEAEAYAESIGARYMETSAKDDMAVQDLFLSLCQQVPLVSPAGGSAIRAGIYLSGPQAEGKAKQGSRTCC
ncbi:ras-related protein rab-5b [Nannochloropsis gaditana]|uniref:Ras-related protein rab-5b n=1 Tax=Nannochloropsis gaditana TaxID=72520 RepID=W7UA70_9STRA|nr:ras-related protein rab-5b [Nannochloropsis gaditana]